MKHTELENIRESIIDLCNRVGRLEGKFTIYTLVTPIATGIIVGLVVAALQ